MEEGSTPELSLDTREASDKGKKGSWGKEIRSLEGRDAGPVLPNVTKGGETAKPDFALICGRWGAVSDTKGVLPDTALGLARSQNKT